MSLKSFYADPQFALLDSFPVPVCHFARAPRCKGFRGQAGFGKGHSLRLAEALTL
ncbi:MAG TPA: hypothetical protein VJ464_26475 [Blastocatellia bacterium]|nr:hypothetical protein [Blastocatellia bacterium]